MKKIAILGAALFAVATAQAQQNNSPVYAEVGYSALKYKEDDGQLSASFKPGALRGIVGYEVSPNLAVEGMLAFGVKNDTTNFMNVNVKGELQNAYGVYVKPKIKVGDNLELFGRLGWTHAKIKASAQGFSISDNGSDVSYGAGLSYSFSRNTYVSADYMNYYDKEGVKIDGFTVGIGFKF
jgi:opacity protein-like surface antigen